MSCWIMRRTEKMVKALQKVEVDKLIDERPLSRLQMTVILLCAFVIFLDGYDIQTLAVSINGWLRTGI